MTQKGSLEAGCAEHPTKPIQKATLLSAIRRLSPPFIESKFQSKIGSAAVFCVDENSAIQALDRLDRCLPLSPGRAEKHGFENAVKLLANLSNAVFSDFNFGYFQGVQKERFSKRYSGRFRVAHGKPPHSLFLLYSGSFSFSEAEGMIVSVKRSGGLALSPLIFWYPCAKHPDQDNGHCYVFDKMRGEGNGLIIRYKGNAR